MSIDDCQRSFMDLAQHVLPTYMVQLKKHMETPISMAMFAVKGAGPATIKRNLGLSYDPTGCYVLLDGQRPIYVGISRSLVQRLIQHVRGTDQFTATLAYRIATARLPHAMRAADAMKDSEFRRRFDEAQEYLRRLDVAFVEIVNPLELYLFEAYCAMELDTGVKTGGWNTFQTH